MFRKKAAKKAADSERISQPNQNTLLSGSAMMTASNLISRILGALYIIPWIYWMGGGNVGAAANGLYQVGYAPYSFFLALSTAGMPSAISKLVSYYNARHEYEVSKSIFRQGVLIMMGTGLVSAVIMFFLAPKIAGSSPVADPNEAVIVIRALTPALMIIPLQSVIRGMIQGHNRMNESAVSQVIEQLVRIIFLLSAVYLIRQVLGGEVVTAVSFTVFAAFVGAAFSLTYLLIRLYQLPTALNRAPVESDNKMNVSTGTVLLDVVRNSIPFIIMSTGIVVLALIDQYTYAPLMEFFHSTSEEAIQISYGIVQGNAQKLTMIITTFGSSLAVTSVPLISTLVSKGDFKEVSRQFRKAILLLMFIMIPATIGVVVLAEPFYTVFFGSSPLGTFATQVYAIVAILISLYFVLGNSLQSANFKKQAAMSLFVGYAVKLIAQPLFIYTSGAVGMLYSKFAALFVTCLIMIKIAEKGLGLNTKKMLKDILKLTSYGLVMGVVIFIVNMGLNNILDYTVRMQGLLGIFIVAFIGLAVYGYIVLKTRIAERLLGDQVAIIRQKLRIS